MNASRRKPLSWAPQRQSRRFGVTVLELVVVSAIMTLLASLLLPALAATREAARRTQCSQNLRQIGIALSTYHDVYRALPAGWHVDATNHSAFGWATATLPYIEHRDLEERIHFSSPIDVPDNDFIRNQQIPLFLCPSDIALRSFVLYREGGQLALETGRFPEELVSLPTANFVGVFGTSDPDEVDDASGDGPFIQDKHFRFADFHRGLSNTFAVGERTSRKLPSTWLGIVLDGEDAPARIVGFAGQGPNQDHTDECEFDSRHPACVHFLWCDGHVAAIADSIDSACYRQFAKR